jgi:ribosomal protein L11 methyltransferase
MGPGMTDYEPFTIGRRFRVVPPGARARGPSSPADSRRIDLVVARGAFGSGEHETTASCLEILETLAGLEGASVLDFGAGTGILAVAALSIGARRAVLVDNDARAVEAAREHCALNGVRDRALVVHGEIDDVPDTAFDLVLANVHGDILVRIAPQLVTRARTGARLVLSGILWEHNWDVRVRYERLACVVLRNHFLQEYSSILMRRQG